jgi:phosphoribosylanthranilate isomerase
MKAKLKVCGLKDVEQINALAAMDIDLLGMIHFEGSKRHCSKNEIRTIFPQLLHPEKMALVTVNCPISEISELISIGFKNIQLHGDEDVSYIKSLKKIHPELNILKAFGIHSNFDFLSLENFAENVHYFLFDTHSTSYGGTGKTFNYNILENYILNLPYFLSGGLSPENINTAQHHALSKPLCIGFDVNSGVEKSPGNKDLIQVQEIIQSLSK